jgi:hypothetical protein
MKTCAQCGAEVTGRFCSSCGAATSEPVTVPTWAPTPVPTPLATKAPLRWHPLAWTRNGYIGLGLGVAALGGTILWLVGLLAIPPLGGVGALLVGIIGFRARNTRTSTAGWWGVACAALALALTVGGLSGAIKQLTTPVPEVSKAHFVAVDVSFDANTQCPRGPSCLVTVTVRNDGSDPGLGTAQLSVNDGGPGNVEENFRGLCAADIPWTDPGSTTSVSCSFVWGKFSKGYVWHDDPAARVDVKPGVFVWFE